MNVHQFNSFDDMMQAVQRWNVEANAGLATAQKAITYGDHWVRFYDVGARIIDFAKVATEAEFVESEKEAGADPDEIAYELQQLQARHDAGYLYGRAHSILNPEGEWGSTHRANVWPIDEALFDAARLVQWRIDHLSVAGKLLLQEAYTEHFEHMKEQREQLGDTDPAGSAADGESQIP